MIQNDWFAHESTLAELNASAQRGTELGMMLTLSLLAAIGMCALIWAVTV